MLIKVDNYPVRRLGELALLVSSKSDDINIQAWFFEPNTKSITRVYFSEEEIENESSGIKKYKLNNKVPDMNGFILINTNGIPTIRKVGHCSGFFIYGYKKNFNIPYVKNEGEKGFLENIIDIFYYTTVQSGDLIDVNNKKYIIPTLNIEKVRITETIVVPKRKIDFKVSRPKAVLNAVRRTLSFLIRRS